MDKNEVSKALAEICDKSSTHYKAAKAYTANAPANLAETLFEHQLSQPLAAVLSRQPEFPNGVGVMIQHPGGASGFHADNAALDMIRQVRGGADVNAVVDWLERVLHMVEAEGLSVSVLWGISVNRPITLTARLQLVPLNSLPDSQQRDWLLQPRDLSGAALFIPWAMRDPPAAAITLRTLVNPVLTKQDSPDSATKVSNDLTDVGILDEARLALTVIGPCAPIHAAGWFQYLDAPLQLASVHSGIRSSHHEIVPITFTSGTPVDPEIAAQVVSAYFKLKEPVHGKVLVALQRLNQALRRLRVEDKALELAIALEVLLTDGAGENTYKVGLRTGLLTEGEADVRLRHRALVSGLYTIRSAVVHDGVAPSKVKLVGIGATDAMSVVTESANVVAYVIKRVILAGILPDWYRFELGHSIQ